MIVTVVVIDKRRTKLSLVIISIYIQVRTVIKLKIICYIPDTRVLHCRLHYVGLVPHVLLGLKKCHC